MTVFGVPSIPLLRPKVRFLFAVYIARPLLLVALSSSVGNLVVLDLVGSLGWNMGIQLGRSQPRAGLSQTSYLPKVRGKRETGVATPLPPCLGNQAWSLGEQSEANGEDAVMEDGTESHQAEIKKKIKANDKLRKILISGDSFKSKMESLDDEKAALLAAKRQCQPLQSRIEKQKNFLERVSKDIESKQKERLEILQQ